MSARFSIVVPVYGVEKYLRECLDSILAQTCSEWECICVDDGSPDDCGKILDTYAAKDSRFMVIHKDNGGVASARNVAFEVMHGAWFICLDPDDVWACKLLECCDKAIAAFPAADILAFYAFNFTDGMLPVWTADYTDPKMHEINLGNCFDHRVAGSIAPCRMFRRDRFADIRERDYVVGEDLLYLAECYVRASKVVSIEGVYYARRIRSESAVRGGEKRRKVMDTMLFHADIAEVLLHSGRRISRATAKWIGNAVTEKAYSEMQLLSGADYGTAFSQWMRVIDRMRRIAFLDCFQKARIYVLSYMPLKGICFLLCYLPQSLKRWGLHR